MRPGPLVLEGTLLRSGRLERGRLGVAGGTITAAGSRRSVALPDGWIAAPGFVDLQVNGLAGAEVGDGAEALAQVAAALARHGVTAFCPTLISRPEEGYRRFAIDVAGAAPPSGARVLRPHLEGPFLNPLRAGAHDPAALREHDPALLDRLLRHLRPAIMTLAPELPGGLEAIRRVRRSGAVAAVGHTEADAEQGRAAIDAGARLLTHAPNAMRGITAREPSALVSFLADRRARVSMIADGIHVDPQVALLLARLAGRRMVLVSDATAAADAPPGQHRLAGRATRSDGTRVEAGGRLAGSAFGLSTGPRTLLRAGLGRASALAAAAWAPRRALGLPAGLAPGDPADLVLVDAELRPRLTVVGGRVAYADPALPPGLDALAP